MRSSLFIPDKYFLYAEDDLDDQELLEQIISRIDPAVKIICCNHGLELMQFLESLAPGEFLPCCIVLDMNMPMWDGMRTLEQLRNQKSLQQVPIIMFTTSKEKKDVDRTLSLGAQAFLTKPLHLKEMEEIARKFSIFCKREPARKSSLELS